MRIAEFVELEQFGRQRLAARMSLTPVLIDANFEFSGHDKRSLWSRAMLARTAFPIMVFFGASHLAAPLNYTILHSKRDCTSSENSEIITPMPPRLARKAPDTYHHGDLRDALVQAALQEAERGGPEAISLKALAKKLGVSQPAPYRHFSDREALLEVVTAEAFRQLNAVLVEATGKPSKQSKLSRFAQATLAFGLRRNGIYRLMFASRTMACA